MITNDNTNVVILDVETTLELPLDRILDGAQAAELSSCLLMGYTATGQFYLSAQITSLGELLILLERAKAVLLQRL